MVRVRWVGTVFAAAQVLTFYKPYPGGLLEVALSLVAVLFLGNVLIWRALRSAHTPQGAAGIATAALAFDAVIVLGFTFIYTFDVETAIWALIYVLPLEGAIKFQLKGALLTMAAATLLYASREIYGAVFFDHPLLPTSISFRMGIGFIVAAVAGSMASGLVKDRDEIEEAARTVKRSEERFRRIFEESPVGMILVDRDGRLKQVNAAFARMLGRDPGGLKEQSLIDLVHPSDVFTDAEQIARLHNGLIASYEVEKRFMTATKDVIWGHMTASLVHEQSVTEPRVLCIIENITARKNAEATLERYAEELREANVELKRSSEMKDHFVAVTNHELRTPLTTIIGFTSLLARRWANLTDNEKREAVGLIGHDARKLHRLVEDLLTLSSARAGAVSVNPRTISLRPAIDEALSQNGAASTIPVSCPPDLTAFADPERVTQIVSNFVSNALKYGEPPISIEAVSRDGVVEVIVRDRGPGVPEAFAPHLFEKFTQANGSNGKGTGLGLAIVDELAKAQGGTVHYAPESPHGSCFTLRLPLANVALREPGTLDDPITP